MRRTLRSLGARPSQPKRLLRRSRQGGWKGFGEFRKDTSELCSEELHLPAMAFTANRASKKSPGFSLLSLIPEISMSASIFLALTEIEKVSA